MAAVAAHSFSVSGVTCTRGARWGACEWEWCGVLRASG
jgi:hypothetical protein